MFRLFVWNNPERQYTNHVSTINVEIVVILKFSVSMAYSLPMAEQLGCASDTMMCGITPISKSELFHAHYYA